MQKKIILTTITLSIFISVFIFFFRCLIYDLFLGVIILDLLSHTRALYIVILFVDTLLIVFTSIKLIKTLRAYINSK